MGKQISLDLFLEIEKKYNLYEDKIEGINYWIYSRFDIWHNIILKQFLHLGAAYNVPTQQWKWKIKIALGLLKRTLFRGKIDLKSTDICFVISGRRVSSEGYYECIYTDELAAKLGNSITVEYPGQMRHMEPVKTSNIMFMDYIVLRRIIWVRCYKKLFSQAYMKLKKEVKKKIQQPLNDLETLSACTIDMEKIEELIVEKIIAYKACVSSTEKWISLLNPQVIIEVESYGFNCMMINEICKAKNIPVIELQHGVMSNHIGYSYKEPKEISQLPDKIFLFSDFWEQYITWPHKEDKVLCTGFPYFERKIKETKCITGLEDKINILFISQGTIGRKLSKFAIELLDIIDTKKYRIIYKLHPGEYSAWKENYKNLIGKDIIILDNSEESLYDYFRTCQIQIGVYSTAIYEGIGFGLDTYIYKIELSEQMQRLVDGGYALYVHDSMEAYDYIKKFPVYREKQELFWKKNAIENMEEYIRTLYLERK